MIVKPHKCGGCLNRWSGANTAHCGRCHITFGGVSGFDYHRKDGHCKTLTALKRKGYVEVRPGVLGRQNPAVQPEEGQ